MIDQITKLMEGAYDTHLHADPGIAKCRDTIVEIAVEAKKYGMKGIVYKDLHFPTAAQANIVMEVIPGIDVIGGVSLSGVVGGLNPLAVEATFKVGGRVVWMFTLDSTHQVKQFFEPGYPFSLEHNRNMLVKWEDGGYGVFVDGTEQLKDDAKEIISLCKQYDAVLETSHLSPKEAFAMVREGQNQKLKKMVVTHANQFSTPYTIEEQKEFIRLGAMINYCYEPYLPKLGTGAESVSNLAELIRAVGIDNVVLGSDSGASFWPSAIESIRMLISGLLTTGFSTEDVARLVQTNPDRIYGK